MWSEHCSYNSLASHLQTAAVQRRPRQQGPGENAGAVDIGDGLAAVFKIESHNHPSFIEPYQGAATGVGGIPCGFVVHDGCAARRQTSTRCVSGRSSIARHLRAVRGVVAGIAGYGNSIGFPRSAARSRSSRPTPATRSSTCSASASRKRRHLLGTRSGVGNTVYYVGAKTGRDGIHGATMASAEFDDEAAEKRPAVQVGDPFMEKLLLEACLEVMQTDALVGIQDMGAAGLTCSTTEMGSRGGAGVEIDVSLVPQRESGMTPYEIMLSESQERMLLVAKRGRERRSRADLRQMGSARGAHRRGDRRRRSGREGRPDRRRWTVPQRRASRRGARAPPARSETPDQSRRRAAARSRIAGRWRVDRARRRVNRAE